MFGLGTQEIVIILVVALLLFGPNQLPEIGKQVGKMLREFRNMSGDVQRAFDLDDTNHHTYDHGYQNRGSQEYGYTAQIESAPSEESTPTETFAYSAPAQGAPIAASATLDTESDAGGEETVKETLPEPESVVTSGGARVYNEPETSEDVDPVSAPVVSKEQKTV